MSYNPIVKLNTTSVTGNTTVTIPAGFSILQVVIQETAGAAITGGIKIGTTNGGTEVITAIAVGANSLQKVSDSTMLKSIFSLSVDTVIYIQAVTLFNSASINLYFLLQKVN